MTKEIFRPKAELTRNTTSSTLGVRGDIFMPDNHVDVEERPSVTRANAELDQLKRSRGEVPLSHRYSVDNPPVIPDRAEEAREAWKKHYKEEGIDFSKLPSDERSTVEMIIKRGIGPQVVTSKGPREMRTAEVIANASLDDQERLKKTRDILGRTLTSEQENALLKAHHSEGGVYNLTPEQLLKRAHILKKEAGVKTKEERRALIEAGIVAEHLQVEGITLPNLTEIVDRINEEVDELQAIDPTEEIDVRNLSEYIKYVEEIMRKPDATDEEKRQGQILKKSMLQMKRKVAETLYKRKDIEKPEGFWQVLKQDDFQMLSDKKYDVFVNKWFDTLYESAAGRDPTTSGALELVQRAAQEADTYLTSVKRDLIGLAELSDVFETRIRLLTMNWGAISSKSIESIQKGSYGLRAHGLMAGETLDKGYTGAMFHRLAELLEDERLKLHRGHLTPELAGRVQDMVIEESDMLAKIGVGIHAGKDRKAIERAVRSAYDILVDSQRMHIIAARGKELFAADAFFSDAGAAFKVFNPKTFVSEKWGILNVTDQRFLREVVQKSLVDEWLENKKTTYKDLKLTPDQELELGDLLFKTLDSPPDFFSSGWRIKGMKDQLLDYFIYKEYAEKAKTRGRNPNEFDVSEWNGFKEEISEEDVEKMKERAKAQAENFGLFIRLKSASSEKDKVNEWKKIEKYRPEEIIRLLREKYALEEMRDVDHDIFGGTSYINEKGERITIKDYDGFKKEFSAAIRAMREAGFRGKEYDPRKEDWVETGNLTQIDFANLTDAQETAMKKTLGEEKTRVIVRIYRSMQRYIRSNSLAYTDSNKIEGTVFDRDYRFVDIYDKTLVVDDILLGDLEVLDKSQRAFSMLSLSKKWSSDLGGDAYVRNMNDLAAGHAYTDELIGFLRADNEEEKFKHAEAAAMKASDYNGRNGQAKALRHTIVPYMWASMPPGFWDTLGVNKLPFRRKMTLIEDIYGHHAKPLTQHERREMMDKMEARLESAIQNELDQLKEEFEENTRKLNTGGLSLEEREELEKKIKEYPHEVEKTHKKGEVYRKSAEKLLKITGGDMLKQQALALLLFLAFGTLGELGKSLEFGKR